MQAKQSAQKSTVGYHQMTSYKNTIIGLIVAIMVLILLISLTYMSPE